MRIKWRTLLNLGISLGLLGWLLATVNWSEVGAVAGQTRTAFFLASFGVFLIGGVLLSVRLHFMLCPTPLNASWGRLFVIWLRSTFYAMCLPSDLGAAVARWYMVTGNETGRRFFVFVTLLERLMLISGSLLLTILPLWLVRDPRLAEFRSVAMPILVVIFAICVAAWSVFVSPVFGWFSRFCHWCRARCRPAWLAAAFAVTEDVEVYRRHPRALLSAMGVHVLFQLIWCLRAVLLFVAMRVDASLWGMVWMTMLMVLITTIPISFAGLGVREVGFAWLTSLYGLGPESGALVGAALSLQISLAAVMGGVANLKAAGKKSAAGPSAARGRLADDERAPRSEASASDAV